MNNFQFPSQPVVTPADFGNKFGGASVPQQNPKPVMFVNVILNLAIPFPPGTEMDENKKESLSRSINSELVFAEVAVMGLHLDSTSIQLQVKFPAHLTVERLIRAIQTRAAYSLHILTGKPVFFSGSAIVSTEDIAPDEILALMS